jgi:hypothetical protein
MCDGDNARSIFPLQHTASFPIRPVEIKRSAPPLRTPATASNGKSVFISNLPTDASLVTDTMLRDAFAHCGAITSVVSAPSTLPKFSFVLAVLAAKPIPASYM